MNSSPAIPRRETLPDGSVRVHFTTPILYFDQAKSFVTFRPPGVGEIWDIGDPIEFVVQDGAGTPYIDRKVLRRWIGLLMADHDADMIGVQRDPALGMVIEDVVLGFFTSVRTALINASAPSSSAA